MEKKNPLSILTQKDVLILKKLLEDGRKSSASISKEIDLGREIVNYRIKRLIKKNLIIKFVPKINEKCLNYKEYVIFLKLNLEDKISKEKFIKEQIGNKYLIWMIKSESGWDLIVRLYAQSIDEFKEKLNEILEKYSNVLARYYTIISSDEIKETEKEILSKAIFKEDVKNADFSIIKDQEMMQIDSKDREIISLLEEDARILYKDIAKKLDVSSDTVKYRIDKMKEQGVIENFLPVINYNKLGLIYYAGIIKFSYLNKESEEEITEKINSSPCIIKAIKNLNSEEFFLTLVFNDEKEISDFEKSFASKFKDKIESLELFKID